MSHNTRKPVVAAFSAAMLTASLAPLSNASVNPFVANPLASGYGSVNMQNAGEPKPAEGMCGNHGGRPQCEGKCGEGKCGDEKSRQCEGKCGEGKCGAEKPAATEGKCGEGKCGAMDGK